MFNEFTKPMLLKITALVGISVIIVLICNQYNNIVALLVELQEVNQFRYYFNYLNVFVINFHQIKFTFCQPQHSAEAINYFQVPIKNRLSTLCYAKLHCYKSTHTKKSIKTIPHPSKPQIQIKPYI